MTKRKGVLVFVCLTAWLLITGTAWAATSYDFISSENWIPPKIPAVELGSLVIRIDPLLEGDHQALFALPDRYAVELPVVGEIASSENPNVKFSWSLTRENEFLGTVENKAGVGRYTFVIPLKSTIPSGVKGDIELTVTGLKGQLVDGVVVVGAALPGEVTIETRGVGLIKDGRSTVEITFRENMAGLLRKGSPIKLTLPEGFGWANAKGTLVSGEGLEVRPLVDGRVLELRTERESTRRAAFRVEAEVRVTDAAKAGSGEVRAGISGLDRVSPNTILVAHYRAPEPEPKPLLKPEPKPEPVVSRTAVFTIGNDRYTSNGVTARMDVVPYLKDGRTYLPLRYVALSLGLGPGDIKWDGAARRAVLTGHGVTVQVTVGSRLLLVDGMKVEIDAAPELVPPGRIMLPYRSIAEAFGARVDWDGATRTVTMTR